MKFPDKNNIVKFSLIGLVVVVILILALTVGRIIIIPPDDSSGDSDDFQYFPSSPDADTGNNPGQIGRRIIETVGEFIGLGNSPTDLSDENLVNISNQPVSGFNFLNNSIVYYIERGTGHLYTNPTDTLNKARLSNTAAPGMHEIWWNNSNDPLFIVERVTERLTTRLFSGVLGEDTKQSGLIFTPVSEDIHNLTARQGELFYFTESVAGGFSLIKNSFNFTAPENVVEKIELKEFNIHPTDNGVFLSTKSSYYSDGTLFKAENNVLTKVLSGAKGFQVTVNNLGDRAMVSEYENSVLVSYLYKIDSGEKITLSNAYLTDKCIASQKSTLFYCAGSVNPEQTSYPDVWFKGLISHNDNIWKIDTETGTETSITTWNSDEGVDIYRPRLSPDEDFLVFLNKKDLSLWSLDITTAF